MSGRTYNISGLVSKPGHLYYEGRPLLNVDRSLNFKSYKVSTNIFESIANKKNFYLKLGDQNLIRLRYIYTYPDNPYDNFFCLSLFKIIKIKVTDYREVLNDLNYLRFLKMSNGISCLLNILCKTCNLKCVVTDVPYLFNSTDYDVIDINKLNFSSSIFYRDIGDLSFTDNINENTLVCLCHDQMLSFMIANKIGLDRAVPLTLVRYPIHDHVEGYNKERRYQG